MTKVTIQMLSDYNDCETCGGGSEEGGRIWIDGNLVWEEVPHAGCYDNKYYELSDLMKIALEKLGIDFEEVPEE
jgi:hypothetical protein